MAAGDLQPDLVFCIYVYSAEEQAGFDRDESHDFVQLTAGSRTHVDIARIDLLDA